MEPVRDALLHDDAWSTESIGQVDGVQDSPLEKLGRKVEVEGRKLEAEEESMTGWCQVRRKGGQVEKVVSAVSRGWEESKERFPHRAHCQRLNWSEVKEWRPLKAWLEGKEDEQGMELEKGLVRVADQAQKEKVEKWLRGAGEYRGGDGRFYHN